MHELIRDGYTAVAFQELTALRIMPSLETINIQSPDTSIVQLGGAK